MAVRASKSIMKNTFEGSRGNSFTKDKFNRVIGAYEGGNFDSPPIQARDITLTLDQTLQEYGERLLQNKRGYCCH